MNSIDAARLRICQFAIGVTLAVVTGCASTYEEVPESADNAARSVVELGPLRVTAEVTPSQARLSDEPVLTLTYEYEQGVAVTKPPFGESLGEFAILGFREPTSTLAGDRQVEQQVYRLEPTTTGELTISPIVISFQDRRPNGDGQEHQLKTEPLKINVTTMVSEEAPALADSARRRRRSRFPRRSDSAGFGICLCRWL